jgi:hypothetical protein
MVPSGARKIRRSTPDSWCSRIFFRMRGWSLWKARCRRMSPER